MKNPVLVSLSLVTVVVVVAGLAGCPAGGAGGTPSPEDSAAVEKVVRDLYTAYTTAGTGDQARTALEASGTPGFIDGLKKKAAACSASAASATPDASCDMDPVVCTNKPHPALTTVVVQTATKQAATATAVVTPEGAPPINVRVALTGDGGAFKIASVTCPN